MIAAVELSKVSRRYGSRPAVIDVDLSVPAGALYGLIGPNGAGKTTCLNMVVTLLPPDAGRLTVCGHDVVRDHMAARRCLGYAPEEPLVYGGLTPLEFCELSATLHGMEIASGREASRELIARFGLEARAGDAIASFSKGMRRKAILCAALVHDPDVLVLDEPLEGLDVLAQDTFKAALRERGARGKTVIYSSHILEVVDELCSHVGLIQRGRVLASGPIEDVRKKLGVRSFVEAFVPGNATP